METSNQTGALTDEQKREITKALCSLAANDCPPESLGLVREALVKEISVLNALPDRS